MSVIDGSLFFVPRSLYFEFCLADIGICSDNSILGSSSRFQMDDASRTAWWVAFFGAAITIAAGLLTVLLGIPVSLLTNYLVTQADEQQRPVFQAVANETEGAWDVEVTNPSAMARRVTKWVLRGI
ncbi:hypothetical protein [Rhodopirellula islandica]|uniref:hypothetical protein n=1 Tax=Rhodopirellula islandica TaxID=595434 RepID=UPI00123729DE|nr:hypothetical protein [Rhodopirellula islandica]